MPDNPVTNLQSVGIIPLAEPELCGNEWAYIKECLDTNWVSSVGSFVDRFEEMLAGYVGSRTLRGLTRSTSERTALPRCTLYAVGGTASTT